MRAGHSLCAARCANDHGIALIAVLWLVALLSVFALGMMALLRSESVIAHGALEDAQAEALADGAFYLALDDLCAARMATDVPVDGSVRWVSVGGRSAMVSIQDEAGKIDVNFAPKELIASLLQTSGTSFAQSTAIAEAIAARREVAGRPKAFHALDELRGVAGISSALLERIKPALTVYAQSAAVSAATAPRDVLLALPGMDAAKADAVLKKRDTGPDQTAEATVGQESLEGRAFTIRTAADVGQSRFVRRAVVRLSGDLRQPYWILEWGSGDPDSN